MSATRQSSRAPTDRGDDTLDGGDRIKAVLAGTWSGVALVTTPCAGGTHNKTNDRARDVVDCGNGTCTVYLTPNALNVNVVKDGCEILNPLG